MKSKDEIKDHLLREGYDSETIAKICGWLIGRGIKDIDERIQIKRGLNDFHHFIKWYDTIFTSFNDVRIGDYIKFRDDEVMIVVHKSDDYVFCMRNMCIIMIQSIAFQCDRIRCCSQEEIERKKRMDKSIGLNVIIDKLTAVNGKTCQP